MQPMEPEIKNVRVFINVYISYSHADYGLRKKLEEHLSSLQYLGNFTTWQEQEILAGENREDLINAHLNEADLILLLISPSFIASKYYRETEVQVALERHQRGEARVIAILLKPVLWQDTPLKQLLVLPRGAKAITQWRNRDAAFQEVVQGIREVIVDLQNEWSEQAQRDEGVRKSIQHIIADLSAVSTIPLKEREEDKLRKREQSPLSDSPNYRSSLQPFDERLKLQWVHWILEELQNFFCYPRSGMVSRFSGSIIVHLLCFN